MNNNKVYTLSAVKDGMSIFLCHNEERTEIYGAIAKDKNYVVVSQIDLPNPQKWTNSNKGKVLNAVFNMTKDCDRWEINAKEWCYQKAREEFSTAIWNTIKRVFDILGVKSISLETAYEEEWEFLGTDLFYDASHTLYEKHGFYENAIPKEITISEDGKKIEVRYNGTETDEDVTFSLEDLSPYPGKFIAELMLAVKKAFEKKLVTVREDGELILAEPKENEN